MVAMLSPQLYDLQYSTVLRTVVLYEIDLHLFLHIVSTYLMDDEPRGDKSYVCTLTYIYISITTTDGLIAVYVHYTRYMTYSVGQKSMRYSDLA